MNTGFKGYDCMHRHDATERGANAYKIVTKTTAEN